MRTKLDASLALEHYRAALAAGFAPARGHMARLRGQRAAGGSAGGSLSSAPSDAESALVSAYTSPYWRQGL